MMGMKSKDIPSNACSRDAVCNILQYVVRIITGMHVATVAR